MRRIIDKVVEDRSSVCVVKRAPCIFADTVCYCYEYGENDRCDYK